MQQILKQTTSGQMSNGFKTLFTLLLTVNFSWAVAQNGLNFDGSNDYVQIPHSTAIKVTTGTVEAWVKTTETGGGLRAVVVKQNEYSIFLNDGFVAVYDWNSATLTTTPYSVANGAWHHVALTFQSGVMNGSKIYVDNQTPVSLTVTPLTSTNHDLGIGTGSFAPVNQMFSGTIDEVRVWNVARTQMQLSDAKTCEYNSPFPAGLVAYYKLNESAGTTATASVGSNGTLVNFALSGGSSNWVAGNASIMGSCTVLSAELLSFSAKKNDFDPKTTVLDWSTGAEKGNNIFEIERSNDGQHFKNIGSVKAKGSAQNYQFTDETPLSKRAYYRLTINDLDGEKYYSKIATVESQDKSKVKVYPSVTSDQVTIEGAKSFSVVNMLGQIVVREGLGSLQGFLSLSQKNLNLSHLPSGFYLVRGVDTEGGVFSEKIFKR